MVNDLWELKGDLVINGLLTQRLRSPGFINMAQIWSMTEYDVENSHSKALYASSGTAHAASHLLREHEITESGEGGPNRQTPFALAASSTSSSRVLSW
jgi:hypothetical protein